jgi:glycine/D-amino acid oxidase-like deaminating enzyme
MTVFEFIVPVVVVGGGASGAVAALAAGTAGAEVLIVEQDAAPTGTTAMSQGLVCAAGTRQQKALGIEDDADTLYTDILAKTRGQTDPAIARAIADGSGPCIDWLTDDIGFPFALDTGFRAAYGHSRQRMHGWPDHGGTDMVQFLHAKLAEHGVDVLMQARLAENDLARLTVGQSADVMPVGMSQPFTGQIWQLSPTIDTQTREGVARIALAYNAALRPGGFASAQIRSGTVSAPLLPESAILSDQKGAFVYVVGGNNKVERRAVKTGEVTAQGIVVIEGLSGSERVVMRAGGFLNPGDPVRPVVVKPSAAMPRPGA